MTTKLCRCGCRAPVTSPRSTSNYARGHNSRVYKRYGDAEWLVRIFRCVVIDERGCWVWQGSVQPNGYGTLKFKGKQETAHRAVYRLLVGPVPNGCELDHRCRNRRCVNPDPVRHIEPVTHRVNVLRGVGFAAVNALKTHCEEGHELAGSNLYVVPGKPRRRHCRTCRRDAEKRYRERRRLQRLVAS